MRRFPVSQVTLTPTFSDKESPGVEAALEKHAVRTRVVVAGERFRAGNAAFEVLHPLPAGPNGTENVRSLVLLMLRLFRVSMLGSWFPIDPS